MSVAGRLMRAIAVIVALTALAAPPARAAGNGGGETISVRIPASAGATCTKDGAQLGKQPNVHRGDRLRCTATGFAAHEQVRVTVQSTTRVLDTLTAEASGKVTYDFAVPGNLAFGLHTLTFTGATSKLVDSFRFVVVPGHGGSSGSGGGSGGAGSGGAGSGGAGAGGRSGAGSGGGPLATTGVAILAILGAALVLIAAGALAAAAGRRQEAEQA